MAAVVWRAAAGAEGLALGNSANCDVEHSGAARTPRRRQGGAGPDLCQINVDQSDGRHALVFFWIEPVPIKFAACGALDLRSEPIEILQSAMQISDVRRIELR